MKRTTVLVADHHHDIRHIVCEFFERLPNFEVIGELPDGVQLLDEVERLNPDILVIDMELPFCNGIEATRIIKGRKLSTKVIVATMFDDPLYKASARQANADGILVKASLKKSLESTFGYIKSRSNGHRGVN